MIAITGDMIDSRRTDLDVAIAFAQEAVQIAPCYYVPGNHESRIEEYAQFREAMIAAGVIVLENAKTRIQYNNEEVTLAGIQDPDFTDVVDEADWISEQLSEILEPEDGFVILLSHRPEYLQTYAESEVDLVLSGHAHGGQIRLPFVGGVIAPNQGLFPDYDGGVYVQENTQMVVSRGVGNSVFPLRVNNRPEVVLIELQKI
jgi:predicted MPP superfamily phosphohydrolase